MSQKLRLILLFVVVILTIVALATSAFVPSCATANEFKLYAGAEMFAVAPEKVTELDYKTVELKLSAARLTWPKHGFLISVTDRSKKHKRTCNGGKAFDRLLKELSMIRAKKVLSNNETAAIVQSNIGKEATLQIRTGLEIDPVQFDVILDKIVIFLDGPVAYEPSLSRDFFDRLSHGCTALSRNSLR